MEIALKLVIRLKDTLNFILGIGDMRKTIFLD